MKRSYLTKYLVLLVIMFICSSLYSETTAERPVNYGSERAGSRDNPFLISTLGNLRWLSQTSRYWGHGTTRFYFLQTNDIDATETKNWSEGMGFMPIGADAWDSKQPFMGRYDGDNHAISNLFIDFRHTGWITDFIPHVAMFGYTRGAEIRNLHLINLEYHASMIDNAASLIGNTESTLIENCSATGVINSEGGLSFVSGLTAMTHSSTISRSSSSVTLKIKGVETIVGGLVGYLQRSTLRDSYFLGSVIIKEPYLSQGGLVGIVQNSTIRNCYLARISGDNDLISIFGSIRDVTIESNFWDSEITDITKLYNTVHADSGENTINNNFGLKTVTMKLSETFVVFGWDFEYIWNINPEINNGYPHLRPLSEPNNEYDYAIDPRGNYLFSNFPNPFNPSTTIRFAVGAMSLSPAKSGHRDMSSTTHVRINVYNLRGQLINTLVDEVKGVGTHSVVWNGTDQHGNRVASGVYFYRLETSTGNDIRRMVLMK